MWNDVQTDTYKGMLAETITVPGWNGDRIRAYYSRPLGVSSYPGIVLIPHMPGWDELNFEVARRYTQHGFAVLCPNIFERFGHGQAEDVAKAAFGAGQVPDESVMGDVAGSLAYLTSQPASNGRVGVTGMCSGGRHAFLAGCSLPGIDAVVECWGGGVVQDETTPSRPVAPIDLTANLQAPLLGIFGNDDKMPSPAQVDQHEAELKKHGKTYEFHRYDGVGHAIWNYCRDSYRGDPAMDSWNKALAFFDRYLKA